MTRSDSRTNEKKHKVLTAEDQLVSLKALDGGKLLRIFGPRL